MTDLKNMTAIDSVKYNRSHIVLEDVTTTPNVNNDTVNDTSYPDLLDTDDDIEGLDTTDKNKTTTTATATVPALATAIANIDKLDNLNVLISEAVTIGTMNNVATNASATDSSDTLNSTPKNIPDDITNTRINAPSNISVQHDSSNNSTTIPFVSASYNPSTDEEKDKLNGPTVATSTKDTISYVVNELKSNSSSNSTNKCDFEEETETETDSDSEDESENDITSDNSSLFKMLTYAAPFVVTTAVILGIAWGFKRFHIGQLRHPAK